MSTLMQRIRKLADAGGMGMPAMDPAAAGGAAPPADPNAGAAPGVPGVAPEQPMDMSGLQQPSMQPQPGMPGQQPGMMQPQAPTPKIDEGTTIIQCVRMLTKVLESKISQSSGNDGIDPGIIQAALQNAEQSMKTLVSMGDGGKPKVDQKTGLVVIQKLCAALVDAEGIPMPASHMVATPDEMMPGGAQSPQGGAAPGGDPNAAQGGMDPNAAPPGLPAPVQPLDPLQAQAGKTAAVDGVAVRCVPFVDPINSTVLARLRRISRA